MKFRIKVNEVGGGDIFLDGKDISCGCYGFNISAEVAKATELEILVRGDVEIEGDAKTFIRLPNGDRFKVV